MAEPTEEIAVRRDDTAGRYEITVDGAVAGFTEFVRTPHGRLLFPHTSIDPAYGGRGLGGRLVEQAMKDAAANGDEVIPACPFVNKWVRTHDVPGLKVDFRDA